MVSQIANFLNIPFNLLFTLQKEYGLRTQRLPTLPNIPRVGGMLTVTEILKNIGLQKGLKIVNNSRAQLKELNTYSLTRKSKKSPTKDTAYGNS